MRRYSLVLAVCGVAGLVSGRMLFAQQITVQQPIVETFSVGTTVSVPDRGHARLGGAARAAAARAQAGPMRLSTSTGVVGQGASVATHARIQDFDEMDRAALGAASRQRAEDTARLTSNAEHAFRQLRGRTSPEKADRERRVAGQARASSANASAVEPGPPVADLLARGKQAEADGKKALALTYFRVAAGRGSSEAAAAVDRLNPPAKRRMASVTP